MLQELEGKRVRGPNGEMGRIVGGQIVVDSAQTASPPPLRQVVAPQARLPSPQTAPQAARDVNAAAASEYDPIKAAADAANAQAKPVYDRFGALAKLRDDVRNDKRILAYESALPIYASALRSPNTPEADTLLVNAIAKIGDPATGVQQREGDAYEDAAPALERIKANLLKQFGSDGAGNFTPEGRQRMKEAMRNRMLFIARGYNSARRDLAEYIRSSGVPDADPEKILGPHFGGDFQQVEADFLGRPVRNVDGSRGAAPRAEPIDPEGAGDIGFEQPGDALPEGAQEFQREVALAIKAGSLRTADDLIAFGRARNFNLDREQAEQAAKSIANGVMPVINTPVFENVDISGRRGDGGPGETVDAAGRGIADVSTFGFADEIAAMGETVFNGGTFRRNLAREREVDKFDTENHFGARLGGQVAGGFAMPLGRIGSTREFVGKSALAGAGYGFGSGEGSIGDRGLNALLGAGAGAATSSALSAAGPTLMRGAGAIGRRIVGPPTPRQSALLHASDAEGVPLNMSDVFPGTRNTVAALETIPGAAGPVQRGIVSGRDAIERRVGDLARGGASREDMGQVVRDAGERFVGRANEQGSRLYRRAERAAGDVQITPQSVMQVLSGLVRQEGATPGGTKAGEVIARYAQAFENGGPVTLEGARRMRSELLSRLRTDGDLSKSQATRLTGQIMAGINEDIERSLTAAGKGRVVELYRTADRFWAQSREEIERVTEKFIGTEARPKSPEEALAAIHSAMGPRGNSPALGAMLRRLSPEERRDFAATLVEPLGRASVDEPFSPATFIRNVRKVSPAARRLIFGGDGEQSIQNLIRLSNAKKETVASLNNSRSGQVGNYRSMLSTLVVGLPGGGAIAGAAAGLNGSTGLVGGLAISGVGLAGSRGLANALMNPRFTRLLASAPATQNPAAINAHVGRMRRLAATNPELRSAVEAIEAGLLQFANDNAPRATRAAASDGSEE